MVPMTLISVIIPAKNRPAMLKEAVESVVAQTYRPIEIIVVLTGATPETKQSAKELAAAYELRVIETKPLNLAATRNVGLSVAKGEWISFLDDDDIWLPEKLDLQMSEAISSGADLVTTNWMSFGENMADELWRPIGCSPLPEGLTYRQALLTNNFVSLGSLFKADIIQTVGMFDPKLRACEDWDFWRRISLNHKIVYIDKALSKIRIHSSNMSANRALMKRYRMMHLIKMLFGLPRDLFPIYWNFIIRAYWTSQIRMMHHYKLSAIYLLVGDPQKDTARVRLIRKIKSSVWPKPRDKRAE